MNKFILVLCCLYILPVFKTSFAASPPDSISHTKVSDAAAFYFPDQIYIGDTMNLIIKRILPDGSLWDLPPDQLFNVHLTPVSKDFYFILKDGRKGKEFFGVPGPFRFICDEDGQINFWAEILENNEPDSTLNSVLTAPSRKLKAAMLWEVGINKTRLGRYKDARKTFYEQIKYDSSTKSYAYYNIACSYSLEDSLHEAIKFLEMASLSGFGNEKYALFEDKDLERMRHLPEFKFAVTARLRKYREALLDKAKINPEQTGEIYFNVARTFLESCDADSFYFWLEKSLRNKFHPGFVRFFDNEFELVAKDSKLDSLLLAYFNNSDSLFFPVAELPAKPLLAKRLKCSNAPEGLVNCANLYELCFTKLNEAPPDDLSNLKNLKILRLSGSELGYFPEVITKIPSLTILDANRCNLKTIPGEIRNLYQLDTLSLQNNLLESFPDSLANLKNLKSLLLNENYIKVFPRSTLEMNQLEMLNLSDNIIRKIPASIKLLDNLKSLHLSENLLEELPGEIGELHHLKNLDLSLNMLPKLPPEIGGLESLEFLDLSFNNLDSLPRTISKLTNLKTLLIFGNRLSKEKIKELRDLLPVCSIIGDEQISLKMDDYTSGVFYSDPDLGLTFIYPPTYTLRNENPENSKKNYSINLLKHGTDTFKDSTGSSVRYHWDSMLKISVLRGNFSEFAKSSGFKNNADFSSAGDHYSIYPLWAPDGVKGIGKGASAIGGSGWHGLYGKSPQRIFNEESYDNNEEYYEEDESDHGEDYGASDINLNAFAVKKFEDGSLVVVSYSTDNFKELKIITQVLLSLQYSKP